MKKRCSELALISSALDEIAVIIRFKGSRLAEIFSELKENGVYKECSFIQLLSERLESSGDFFCSWEYACKNCFYLEENDRKVLINVGGRLGSSDTESQLTMLDYNSSLIKNSLLEAEKKRAEKTKVLMSVSTLSGIALGIIIL